MASTLTIKIKKLKNYKNSKKVMIGAIYRNINENGLNLVFFEHFFDFKN